MSELRYETKICNSKSSITMENKIYEMTLQFVFIKAFHDIFKNSTLIIEHSLGRGIFGEINKKLPLTELDIIKVKNRMKEIINSDIPINRIKVRKKTALDIFTKYNMPDKIKLLNGLNINYIYLYEMDGLYDYFYGNLGTSTGILKQFDLIYYNSGFLLRYPDENKFELLTKPVKYEKLNRIFRETKNWLNVLGISDVGSLNNKIKNNEISYITKVAEAFHEKKIAYIADTINSNKSIKVVLIAGPSSSGKTTFSKRLAIQLGVNGYSTLPISLDNYFLERQDTPKDKNGNYDFESINSLDLDLFNRDLKMLMAGREVKLPTFDFKSGTKKWNGKKTKLPENGLIVIEGIHGLNEMLTASIPGENKFKIYISALTQLNLDNHNRISTTDVRIIRRIVRDHLFRGYSAEDTLKMWPSVRRGEEKNIFVFQENADVMFNSMLVYELCILKEYALKELNRIKKDSTVYCEALRLINFLKFFKNIDKNLVPANSILREFIGGSCFYN